MGQVSDEYSNSTGVGNWPTLGFGFIYINLPYVNLFSHHLQTSSSKSVLSVTILFNILILLCVHLVAACLCCWAVVGHFTLGFSFQYKLSFTSCEHLGKSMRSTTTQYIVQQYNGTSPVFSPGEYSHIKQGKFQNLKTCLHCAAHHSAQLMHSNNSFTAIFSSLVDNSPLYVFISN